VSPKEPPPQVRASPGLLAEDQPFPGQIASAPSRLLATGEWSGAGDAILRTALSRLPDAAPDLPGANPKSRGRVTEAVEKFLHLPQVELTIVGLIILSILGLFLETSMPPGRVMTAVEVAGDVITWTFVIELVLRFWVARKKRRFLRRYWVDIIAVLPVLRPLRSLRVLRLLRVFRAGALLNRRLSVFQDSLRGTFSELTTLATVTAALVMGSALILLVVEGPHNEDFETLEDVLWYSVYSLIGGEPISVDQTPATSLGRMATLMLMFGGLTTFGVFVATVSASMVQRFAGRVEINAMDMDELRKHTIVCGWNRAGGGMLLELFGAGEDPGAVVLITQDDVLPHDMPREGIRRDLLYHLTGDYTKVDVLEEAGVRRAGTAIILSDGLSPRSAQDRDARTVLAALTVERLAPGIFTVAELTSRENAGLLKMAGVEEIIVPDEYTATILGSASRNRGMVSILEEILSARVGNSLYKFRAPKSMHGVGVGKLSQTLRRQHNAIFLGLERPDFHDPNQIETLVNPAAEEKVRPGDHIVVIAERAPEF
jgi:voltage-gated potassium channel